MYITFSTNTLTALLSEQERTPSTQLVVKAVSLAIARDGASGGVVRTVTINKDGVTRKFYPVGTLPLWHEEMEHENSLLDTSSAASPEPMDLARPICMVSLIKHGRKG
ncbi:proteasome subunit beta type-6-like isoform X4 [Sesamum indicum]|uniref:Proteasome subunit beta type-6-like isoform X4 n=1 Tax=Sesamum indicum TaxID=4182 RepID=A0A8M8UTK0_SESIN|nr:proteasome subunit beta type-6-like isoform X4 [Sesamum indicum]XP_020547310.1 proteasome subunit beta type-6-like isoform X4 [Sesamum indicum]